MLNPKPWSTFSCLRQEGELLINISNQRRNQSRWWNQMNWDVAIRFYKNSFLQNYSYLFVINSCVSSSFGKWGHSRKILRKILSFKLNNTFLKCVKNYKIRLNLQSVIVKTDRYKRIILIDNNFNSRHGLNYINIITVIWKWKINITR